MTAKLVLFILLTKKKKLRETHEKKVNFNINFKKMFLLK